MVPILRFRRNPIGRKKAVVIKYILVIETWHSEDERRLQQKLFC